jgi:hypothetical protein
MADRALFMVGHLDFNMRSPGSINKGDFKIIPQIFASALFRLCPPLGTAEKPSEKIP